MDITLTSRSGKNSCRDVTSRLCCHGNDTASWHGQSRLKSCSSQVIDLIALVSKHADKRSHKHIVSSVSSDMHQDVRKQSVKQFSLLCGDMILSDVEKKDLTEQLKVLASDPFHSVALNLLQCLVRFNHSGKKFVS